MVDVEDKCAGVAWREASDVERWAEVAGRGCGGVGRSGVVRLSPPYPKFSGLARASCSFSLTPISRLPS